MRYTQIFSILLIAILFASCTKEGLLSDPLSGTILELGFGWMEAAESCLDSNDHSTTYCGQAVWLDGTRVQIDLTALETGSINAQNPVLKEVMESKSIRYVYNPTSRTVTLFLSMGKVTLEWNESLGCLEGDLFDHDFLSICSSNTASSPGI